MTIPNLPAPPGPLISEAPSETTGRRVNSGQLFTMAMLKAGRDGCNCASCKILLEIVTMMEADVEARIDAGKRNNPQP